MTESSPAAARGLFIAAAESKAALAQLLGYAL